MKTKKILDGERILVWAVYIKSEKTWRIIIKNIGTKETKTFEMEDNEYLSK